MNERGVMERIGPVARYGMLVAMVIVRHVDGSMENVEHVDGGDLLKELKRHGDEEHPDVAVSLNSGWSLGVLSGGRAFLENLEDLETEPRHLTGLSDNQVVALIELIATTDVDVLLRLPWRPGYPTVA